MRRRLDDYQLDLIGEVAAITESALCAVFGGAGRALRAQARGIDPRPVLPPEQQAEFHVAHALATDTNDLGVLHPLLRLLGERLGRRLRRRGLVARRLRVALSYADHTAAARAVPLHAAALDAELWDAARRAFTIANARRLAVRTVALTLDRLEAAEAQLDLWEEVGGVSSHFEHGEGGLSEDEPPPHRSRRPGAPASREPGPRLAGCDRSYPRSLGRARRGARHRPRARRRVAESDDLIRRQAHGVEATLPVSRDGAVDGSAEIVERFRSESDSLPSLFSMAASRARSRLERLRSRFSVSFVSLSAAVAPASWPCPAASPRGPSRAHLEASRAAPGPAGHVPRPQPPRHGSNPEPRCSSPMRCQERRWRSPVVARLRATSG